MNILLDLQGAQTESRLRGIGRQALGLATAILRRNRDHEIAILLNDRLTDNLDALRQHFAALLPEDRIKTFHPPGAVAERDPRNLWRATAAELLREATIARLQPDIVHLSSLFEGYVDDAVTSIGRLGTRFVTAATLHDLIPLADADRYLGDPGPRRHWLRRAQSLKRADLLVSVSEASKREAVQLLHIPPERITVISAGVDPMFHPVPLDEVGQLRLRTTYRLDRPFLLYVGAIDARKNVDLIFEAFARLPSAVQDAHLLAFAGTLFDEEIGQLRLAAAGRGIPASTLRFCRHVPDDDLVALYQASAVFVFPSVREGFGLPALEAMACGAAVLASNTTSLPEVVGNDALLFDPRDAAALATKLTTLLTDDAASAQARAFGVQRAATFTWDESARRALAAFEAAHERHRAQRPAPHGPRHETAMVAARPRLAFLSPLPPEQSGIASYSVALLRELGRFYDIECIGIEADCDDPWVVANFPLRDIAFFERNATRYDRIVYCVGNSHFHAHMLALMERFAGVVILHDFVLSDLIDWMSSAGRLRQDGFVRELYRTHGLAALIEERASGRRHAIDRFACNGVVFRAAQGVIVHSRYALDQARTLFGASVIDRTTVIPHLKAVPAAVDRRGARERLGLADRDILVCSFGILTRRKCSRDLCEAWLASATGRRAGARLVFVGATQDGPYGQDLQTAIAAAPEGTRIDITGYVDQGRYRDYLAAADLAVQLRTTSRGETSGAVLDCLASGVAVVVNAHGPAAEYPDDVVVQLPDRFTTAELADTIDAFCGDPALRAARAARGLSHIGTGHDPALVGALFHEAIERFFGSGAERDEQTVLDAVARITLPVGPDQDDLLALTAVIARERPRVGPRQILYDVTVLAAEDARTGIQRVVRGILLHLASHPPDGYVVELVRMDGPVLRYARSFAGRVFDIALPLPDEVCTSAPGDVYLSIDWVPDRLPDVERWLSDFRKGGGRVVIGVHDLLPFQMPQFFPDFMAAVTRKWFEASLRVADQFVCVSAAVADDVVRYGRAVRGEGHRPIAVDVVHNAADLDASLPTTGLPVDGAAVLARLNARPTFLMVGTVEPRKGHIQVLRGFEALWRQGIDVGLVIIGKKGWMMDGFETEVDGHPEQPKRLLWLRGISDQYLKTLYAGSAALIAASEGEGFGLPLIEAAVLGTPLIARDLPVFREVAGPHAFYFQGLAPQTIADAVTDWMALHREGRAPSPEHLPTKTWQDSTADLKTALFAHEHYRVLA